jgi:hypothetical protein
VAWTVRRLDLNRVRDRVFGLLSEPGGRLLAAPFDKPICESTTEVANGEIGELAVISGKLQISVFGAGMAGPHVVCEVVAQEVFEEVVRLS